MRRRSRTLRDLVTTLVVAASLVVVPPPDRAAANTSCTVQEWGTWSGQAAQMNVGWGSSVATWSVWITPAGTLAGLLNSPSRSAPGTRIGGGTGSSGSFTWNTYAFPNGLYDLAFTYVQGRTSGGSYAYCALRIANVPAAPTGVVVSPTSSSSDLFDVSWTAPSVPGGVAYYEYAVDCDTGRSGTTSGTGVRISGLVRVRGSHWMCVRAVDRAGLKGAWGTSGWFSYTSPTPAIIGHSASRLIVGMPVTTTATLVDPSGRPLAGRQIRFFLSQGTSAYVTTDAAGRASVTLAGPAAPGQYDLYAIFYGDGTHGSTQSILRLTAVRDTVPPSRPVVAVTPASSTTNRFTATFPLPRDDASGLGVMEFRIDGGTIFHTGSFAGYTAPTVSLPIQAPSYGLHRVEVQAVDGAGNRSGWSEPARFEWRPPASSLTILSAAQSTVIGVTANGGRGACPAVVMSAYLSDGSNALPGQVVTMRIGSLTGSATTLASGAAIVTLPGELAAGSYAATATYTGSALVPGSTTTRALTLGAPVVASCVASGGGGGQPGGGGGSGGGGQPGGGAGQSGRGGLSVDIPAR